MKLKNLEIKLVTYGPNEGKYESEIEYVGESGSTKMLLDIDVSQALLQFIGPVITKFAHKAALEVEGNLQASFQESRAGKLIEAEKETP